MSERDDAGRLRALLRWSSQLAAESSPEDTLYLYPDSIVLLRERLKATEGALIGVVGLRGVGKSSAASVLAGELEGDVVYFKWAGEDPLDLLGEQEALISRFKGALAGKIGAFLRVDRKLRDRVFKLHELREAEGDGETAKVLYRIAEGQNDPEDLEDYLDEVQVLLPPRSLRALRREAADEMLISAHDLLIDMPDYPSRDPRRIGGDIDIIQRLWNKARMRGYNPNIILFLQAETFSTQDHFFFGKLYIYRIDPFKPEQLYDYYMKSFGSAWPFQDETLRYIARISRGIFRRFKRFISICLEWWQIAGTANPIDGVFVRKYLSSEKIFAEMDLELSHIFRHEATKDLAVKLLQVIVEKKDQNQKELSKALEVNEMALSRMLDKLEQYGYVRREKRTLPEGGAEYLVHSVI